MIAWLSNWVSEIGRSSLFDHPYLTAFVLHFDPEGLWRSTIGTVAIKLHVSRLASYASQILCDEDFPESYAVAMRREDHASFYDRNGHTIQIPPEAYYQMVQAFVMTFGTALSDEDRADLHTVMTSIANLMVLEHF